VSTPAAALTASIRRRSGLASLALLGVTAAWGSTFFMIKDLLHEVSVLDFLAVRFTIAALAVVALAPRRVRALPRRQLRNGALLGFVYGVAQILQTTGLERTAASVSGFVTGMYVIATPFFAALLLSERVGRAAWLAAVVATVGLAVLSLSGFSVSFGVALIFASAMLYALHIVGLGRWSIPEHAYGLTAIQMVVIAVVCMAATVSDGVDVPRSGGGWASLLYMAMIAGALAILLQTWAQAHLAPTRAAIIMTMEPVFAAAFAVAFGGESTSVRLLIGGLLVLGAMLIVELAPRRKVEAESPHIAV
jgi:drug/metabolite transporter (DMT)-like permease